MKAQIFMLTILVIATYLLIRSKRKEKSRNLVVTPDIKFQKSWLNEKPQKSPSQTPSTSKSEKKKERRPTRAMTKAIQGFSSNARKGFGRKYRASTATLRATLGFIYRTKDMSNLSRVECIKEMKQVLNIIKAGG